jgi:hypothetical protein
LKNLANKNNIVFPQNPHRYLYAPLILRFIALGEFGHYDYFFFAGAGCEINSNIFARSDLRMMKRRADKYVFHVEHTLLCEAMYSKKELLNFFAVEKQALFQPQIMATFFLVSPMASQVSLDAISNDWLEVSLEGNGRFISDDYNPGIQEDCFIEPRHDQSIFSILLHTKGVKPLAERQRNFGKFLPGLRGSKTFIWTPRNRTGNSILPRFTSSPFLGFVFSFIQPFHNLVHYCRTKYRWRNTLIMCEKSLSLKSNQIP